MRRVAHRIFQFRLGTYVEMYQLSEASALRNATYNYLDQSLCQSTSSECGIIFVIGNSLQLITLSKEGNLKPTSIAIPIEQNLRCYCAWKSGQVFATFYETKIYIWRLIDSTAQLAFSIPFDCSSLGLINTVMACQDFRMLVRTNKCIVRVSFSFQAYNFEVVRIETLQRMPLMTITGELIFPKFEVDGSIQEYSANSKPSALSPVDTKINIPCSHVASDASDAIIVIVDNSTSSLLDQLSARGSLSKFKHILPGTNVTKALSVQTECTDTADLAIASSGVLDSLMNINVPIKSPISTVRPIIIDESVPSRCNIKNFQLILYSRQGENFTKVIAKELSNPGCEKPLYCIIESIGSQHWLVAIAFSTHVTVYSATNVEVKQVRRVELATDCICKGLAFVFSSQMIVIYVCKKLASKSLVSISTFSMYETFVIVESCGMLPDIIQKDSSTEAHSITSNEVMTAIVELRNLVLSKFNMLEKRLDEHDRKLDVLAENLNKLK